MRFLYNLGLILIILSSCTVQNSNKETNLNTKENIDTTSNELLELIADNNETNNVPDTIVNTNENEKTEIIDTIGNCEKCNIRYVVNVDKNISNLQENEVRLFLCTFSPLCEDDAEFGEFSNKVLFKLLDTNTELFFKVLTNEIKNIHIELILYELENPINDLINIKVIKNKVNEIEIIDNRLKDKVLKALQNAPEY